MLRYILDFTYSRVRAMHALALVFAFVLLTPLQVFGVGFIPSDAGLVVNFQKGDQFLLSVWIDVDGDGVEDAGEEYFVCDYPSHKGGRFNYSTGDFLKLVPQDAAATEPSKVSIWTIDSAFTGYVNSTKYTMDGISYSMWSYPTAGNPTRTIYGKDGNRFKFYGDLIANKDDDDLGYNLATVAFVVPTVRAKTNMDPNNTFDKGDRKMGDGSEVSPSWAFDGKMGRGFLGMVYREVYWFEMPRLNGHYSYTNAALVTFNTTTSNKSWSAGTIAPGKAAYAYADTKHQPTTRTLFRLYVLNEKEFTSCNSYFFGWNTQSTYRYRKDNSLDNLTEATTVYTLDHLHCMEYVEKKEGPQSIYQTEGMQGPPYANAYYYVGYNNEFYAVSTPSHRLGSSTAVSAFTTIDSIRVRALRNESKAYVPERTAYGSVAIDTTSDKDNLNATFEPIGYFFQTSSGRNVEMRAEDDTTWITKQMWYIEGEYMELSGKVMLYTGPEFSESDPGAEIKGWSKWVSAKGIPVAGDPEHTASGKYGWARIHTERPSANGGIEFVLAQADKRIRYHNNGHFGSEIPDQFPVAGSATVTVEDAKLMAGYDFLGWAASEDGDVVIYPEDSENEPHVGQTLNLASLPAGLSLDGSGILHLYAKAVYRGTINVAFSFLKEDGKRYFLTHPAQAPRFARARTFDDWTNVYQGMSDADNTDPNYLSTFKILGKNGVCELCQPDEYVLKPTRETMYGGVDSLILYEDYQPATDEYLGLYYTDPNTLIANNTWAGAFLSSEGWPTPSRPCIDSTRVSSINYFYKDAKGDFQVAERPNSAAPEIKYNATDDQFDGVAVNSGTDFMISGAGVVDNHYVVIPDTTVEWNDTIVFDYHDKAIEQQVWSKLIGKQLLAQMKVGDDTIYFHPNRDKIFTTANVLRLSTDFRLTESFTFIPDSRAESTGVVAAKDKATMSTSSDGFARMLTSGEASPVDVIYQGTPIDIVDTIRITLSQSPSSKIKTYYGRWKTGAEGLKVSGYTRTRDILVRTKTYHSGAAQTRLVLKPERETYHLGALEGQSEQLNFLLLKETYSQLFDDEDNLVSEKVTATDTITNLLALSPSDCRLVKGESSPFTLGALTRQVTLTTKADNAVEEQFDTLVISKRITVDAVNYDVTVRVPLSQTALIDNELIWSAVDAATGQRYFIMAGGSSFIFRQYLEKNSTLYQKGSNNVVLIKGSADAANSDDKYITPWEYTYADGKKDQLTLKIGLTESDTLHFVVSGSPATPGVNSSGSSALTFRFAGTNTNANGNYEELVRLKYGANQWLKFSVSADVPSLSLQEDSASATVFYWGYLMHEYNLQNKGTYPSVASAEFGYNDLTPVKIQTRYKAYREYSMLLNNQKKYLCRETEEDIADLINPSGDWKISYDVQLLRDCRFGCEKDSSKLAKSLTESTMTTTITPSGDSPLGTKYNGKYTYIVDTLRVHLVPLEGAPEYRFAGDWSKYASIDDATVKIPLSRRTYHEQTYDSVVCVVNDDEENYTFPNTGSGQEHEFVLRTIRRKGSHILGVNNGSVASTLTSATDLTSSMALNDPALAEIRLIDGQGNTPTWCEISDTTASTITVRCTENGIRSPRQAFLYFAYVVTYTENAKTVTRYVNYSLTVSQPSRFTYANNQVLIPSEGASGDPLVKGQQQVHENKRILYYYNPEPYDEPDQKVELPIRERDFYGWWRWYREGEDEFGNDVTDADVPDSLWITPPRNESKKLELLYPYRAIGDSVWVDEEDHDKGKKLATMGRYTVFHYPSSAYPNAKQDPPGKVPFVKPPHSEKTLTYALDMSNYYDNLPLSMKKINNVDTAKLDTMRRIIEPTLSLREVYELRPWTEMAARMEDYKYAIGTAWKDQTYMEDHVVMAPTGNRLLLSTEQRYYYNEDDYENHSESLLGYYMRDDHWSDGGWTKARKDTMIWCAGWDAPCGWYTYNPSTGSYDTCTHTLTKDNDFLQVPAHSTLSAEQEADTVYYCLRARSWSTTRPEDKDVTVPGAYWFNICRYTVIYHRPEKYGPKLETAGVALMTNDEIEQHYEVLERLNFDYNQPGSEYTIYPHPLPWADVSYGYTYPESADLPHNRYHSQSDFPGPGEYALINYIKYDDWWKKMEQHGGKENGYMIYCDGMSSAGQVAALTLSTKLCEGQKMYFSAFVGNPSDKSQSGKAKPNFTFSVQGSDDGKAWEDITTYMTGDIDTSSRWYQIYFPIVYDHKVKQYDHFRVRIYNMASSFDGNDFVLDDMCLFATKPSLVAYQANTTCSEGSNDSIHHVVLRIDYQGIQNDVYNGQNVYYTVEKISTENDTSFIHLLDGFINELTKPGAKTPVVKPDTIYGTFRLPEANYEPTHADSIYTTAEDLILRFDTTFTNDPAHPVRLGYVYEEEDEVIRPILYVIHKAKVTLEDKYIVRMHSNFDELINSICAMTDTLKVSNHMMLELDGTERTEREITNLCPNSSYDIGIRVKGSLYREGMSPVNIDGTCTSDWLLYGDTTAYSETRYGYCFEDIVKVVTRFLRNESESNTNRFAKNLAAVNSSVLASMQRETGVSLKTGDNAYTVLSNLVNKGFLKLYQSKVTATLNAGDSVQYVALPITGTGYDASLKSEVDVCPNPMVLKFKAKEGTVNLVIGGLHRDSTQAAAPVVVLANETNANMEIKLHIDSLISNESLAVLDAITMTATDDPNFRKGISTLSLLPDREYDFGGGDNSGYYKTGDTIALSPAPSAYHMRAGYSYTFTITLQTKARGKVDAEGCAIGSVPFIVSVVPDYVRWNPQSAEGNQWNNPDNWLGVDQYNRPIHEKAHFAPLATSSVIIPTLASGLPYPVLPDPSSISSEDSIKQVGFEYNVCADIRFMPGAALAQQQRLSYDNAIVDMSLPYNKWALRGAPVNGVLTGDIFMANADINGGTLPWEVGEFDASGRNYKTGNASFWMSVYSRSTTHKGNGVTDQDEEHESTEAEWSRTNSMTLSLPPAQGWAVYARTAAKNDAAVRLPKDDDIYYYYNTEGDKMLDIYEYDLRSKRNTAAGGSANTGKLAFHPDGTSQRYTLEKDASDTMYVFANPTMGYIDIWGFIADNASLKQAIGYLNKNGEYVAVSKATAEASSNVITNLSRYLPPMHAMIVSVATPSKSLEVTLKTNRVVTAPTQVVRPGAPKSYNHQSSNRQLTKGIMTITAINPVSDRCTSYLQLGQGYHNAIVEGEDAVLTTINIHDFNMTGTPTTPFNIYAVESGFGLSIDLKDSLVCVPVSFYMSDLPYDPVTYLWFTGVNSIDGTLVLYDKLTDSERTIVDGICLGIETPETSHQNRYYICRKGYKPNSDEHPIATGYEPTDNNDDQAKKIIYNGHVLILRNGHVYTMYGQKIN